MTGIAEILFQHERKEVKLSSAFQLISLLSFSCVRGPLGVSFKSDRIKSNHVKSMFPMFSCAKRFCVLPSDPPAQVVQHVHFQGAGTDVRCLPHKNEVDLNAPYDHVTLPKSGANLFLYLSIKTST